MLHPRNRHQGRYDFARLIKDTPELAAFVFLNPYGNQSIDFADPGAVKLLNRALLKTYYNIKHWDIPVNYLCPPIPGRADYVHHLADLLATNNAGIIPSGATVRVLDIGVGANAIYPLIGHAEYGWAFLGSDIDAVALTSARTIIQANPGFSTAIKLRQQKSHKHIFQDLLGANDYFDLTLCNPPFHTSREDALSGTRRKWRGLGKAVPKQTTSALNFGGQSTELWCEGGEALFIRRMIEESTSIRSQVLWFSTLVSKESNLPGLLHALRKVNAFDVRTVEMTQGQKKSRFIAWTFLNAAAQQAWRSERWR
ncbi:23S rRNA (adenine(1618)-N(6))-methyltransferase RlmF [Paenalcaligenes niemegkensis]|uniref:23S rRNA (adenine(1618)-N(6))-methyltransferase RlmF n=1 Tax=Paenalcaligenes niemegkensis TaxID=2895469 RepID=UPI001EE97AC6|nr:23S rRNA (adenine(1618)-N(6))-methyltransferase RlmF [Paenalcaligenes niemegkensis]MCQ9616077.1 23S rRNA (adenine(1618)-N(6))-methyltransferase RlmF [Paenalcaligenes niemegkensis]